MIQCNHNTHNSFPSTNHDDTATGEFGVALVEWAHHCAALNKLTIGDRDNVIGLYTRAEWTRKTRDPPSNVSLPWSSSAPKRDSWRKT